MSVLGVCWFVVLEGVGVDHVEVECYVDLYGDCELYVFVLLVLLCG